MSSETYVLLNEQTEPPDVFNVADALGWVHVQTIHAGPTRFHEQIWHIGDGEPGVVRYIEDHFVDVRYFVVAGAEHERTAKKIEERIATVSHSEAFEMAESNQDEEVYIDGLRFLAVLGALNYRKRIAAVCDSALCHPSVDVRSTVLTVISRLTWPELAHLVQKVAEGDPDPEVRRDAAALFDLYRAHGKLPGAKGTADG
jgi:hypothetical protein